MIQHYSNSYLAPLCDAPYSLCSSRGRFPLDQLLCEGSKWGFPNGSCDTTPPTTGWDFPCASCEWLAGESAEWPCRCGPHLGGGGHSPSHRHYTAGQRAEIKCKLERFAFVKEVQEQYVYILQFLYLVCVCVCVCVSSIRMATARNQVRGGSMFH